MFLAMILSSCLLFFSDFSFLQPFWERCDGLAYRATHLDRSQLVVATAKLLRFTRAVSRIQFPPNKDPRGERDCAYICLPP
jgi:hypothetical protein